MNLSLNYNKKSKANPVGGWDLGFVWCRKDKVRKRLVPVGRTKIKLKTKELQQLQRFLNIVLNSN